MQPSSLKFGGLGFCSWPISQSTTISRMPFQLAIKGGDFIQYKYQVLLPSLSSTILVYYKILRYIFSVILVLSSPHCWEEGVIVEEAGGSLSHFSSIPQVPVVILCTSSFNFNKIGIFISIFLISCA